METSKLVQYALLNINKKKTSLCPEKYKVHIGQGFTNSLITFIEWLKQQPFIDGEATVDTWNYDPESDAKIMGRLSLFEMTTKSDSGSDLETPGGLT